MLVQESRYVAVDDVMNACDASKVLLFILYNGLCHLVCV